MSAARLAAFGLLALLLLAGGCEAPDEPGCPGDVCIGALGPDTGASHGDAAPTVPDAAPHDGGGGLAEDVIRRPDVPVIGRDEGGGGADAPSPVADGSCGACGGDEDCAAGFVCAQLGAQRGCLPRCADDGDCRPGWLCYPLTNEDNLCVPASFDCGVPCLTGGCPAGFVCDQEAAHATWGQCVQRLALCDACRYDWQCGDGRRCLPSAGGLSFCLPECDTQVCPDWATCVERGGTGGAGVFACRPQHATCCGAGCADECVPACSGARPVCHDGQCVQCLGDEDCEAGATCDPLTDRCVSQLCADQPTLPFEWDGQCVQCLSDDHCGPAECDPATHTCFTGHLCGGQCIAPYPACVVINGVPSCVPCSSDEHCPVGVACDRSTYSCGGGDPPPGCAGDCLLAGCPDTTGQFNLECDPDSGCCYDTTGLCDDVEAFCRLPSVCLSVFEIFGADGLPGLPAGEGYAGGMCTCDATYSLLCDMYPDNPLCAEVPLCYPGVSCNAIGTILQYLTGGSGGALVSGDFCSGPLL